MKTKTVKPLFIITAKDFRIEWLSDTKEKVD